MDVKEKLIDILKQAPFEGKVLDEWWLEEKIKMIADHLIANGVTVQNWIPITERLPGTPNGWAENPEPVLYMMKNTKNIYAGYYGEGGVWRDKYFRQYEDSREGVDAHDVLCWMWQHDLPKPPKGE